jgi:hypothetical protein
MTDPVIIFNLADTSGADVDKAATSYALRQNKWYRKSREIIIYDLFELIANNDAQGLHRHGSENPVEFGTIRRQCQNSKKIIISTHGPYHDTGFSIMRDPANLFDDHAEGIDNVPNVNGAAVQINLDQIADLMGNFLETNRSYYISLLVCYAARSDNFRVDQMVTGNINWASSFACRLFARLCKNRTASLTMSARTGQHGISTTSGLSEVQTEEAVLAEIDYADLPGDLDTWIEDTKLTAIGPRNAIRHQNTLDFATNYFTTEAGLGGPQRVQLLARMLGEQPGLQMPQAERQNFVDYLEKMRLDSTRSRNSTHYGKIYYYFNSRQQQITIKHARVTSKLKRRVKDTLQTVRLAAVD